MFGRKRFKQERVKRFKPSGKPKPSNGKGTGYRGIKPAKPPKKRWPW